MIIYIHSLHLLFFKSVEHHYGRNPEEMKLILKQHWKFRITEGLCRKSREEYSRRRSFSICVTKQSSCNHEELPFQNDGVPPHYALDVQNYWTTT